MKKSPIKPNNSGSEAPQRIKLDIPKYRGLENERPVRFLSEFDKYVNVVRPNFDQLLCLISQALLGDAKDWWYLQEAEIDSYDQFIVLFRERYWSANTQRTAKRKIEYGQYSPGGKLTRVEYATNLFGLGKKLDLKYTEAEFVLRISEHFERNIRHAVLGQQVKDKNMLLKILTEYDGDDQRHRKHDKFNSQINSTLQPKRPTRRISKRLIKQIRGRLKM